MIVDIGESHFEHIVYLVQRHDPALAVSPLDHSHSIIHERKVVDFIFSCKHQLKNLKGMCQIRPLSKLSPDAVEALFRFVFWKCLI